MALAISEFRGVRSVQGSTVQIPDGPPSRVSPAVTGSYTVEAGAVMIRIKGAGTITWAGVTGAESFDGTEFRGVRPGDVFTVA